MSLPPPKSQIDSDWIATHIGPEGVWGAEAVQRINAGITSQSGDPAQFSGFICWKEAFSSLYPEAELDLDLYSLHCLLTLAMSGVLQATTDKPNQIILSDLGIPEYFQWVMADGQLLTHQRALISTLGRYPLASGDLFSALYQMTIAHTTRHVKGEFYTPTPLCRLMVRSSYRLGQYALDPACGSGSFLVAIARQVAESQNPPMAKQAALDRLYGVDLNPLACAMARANILITSHREGWGWDPSHIIHANALKLQNGDFSAVPARFDLVIGNPPWLVLNGVPSSAEKAFIKQRGQQLGILRGGRYATSTELTAVFFCHAVQEFLADGGTIHFLGPASLASGAQHGLFRQFAGVRDVEIWDFTEDIFRIHSLCLKASKGPADFRRRIKVRWQTYRIQTDVHETFHKVAEETYVPALIESLGPQHQQQLPHTAKPPLDTRTIVGRLIPQQRARALFGKGSPLMLSPKDKSPYHPLFRQGASLVPRNLLFVDVDPRPTSGGIKSDQKGENPRQGTLSVRPAASLISKKYGRWDFHAYKQAQIEGRYIFPVAKSTGLLSFHQLVLDHAALPLVPQPSGGEASQNPHYALEIPPEPHAQAHFSRLTEIYAAHMKPGAKITSLFARLDYGHALTDPRQFQTPKVIFGGIGSNVKAALLPQFALIDTSLYFYVPHSLDEAHYLLGLLNAPVTTEFVRVTGSTGANGSLRNIHKYPLHLPFPKFHSEKATHMHLASLARQCAEYTQKFTADRIKAEPSLRLKPKTLQNALLNDQGLGVLLGGLDLAARHILEWK